MLKQFQLKTNPRRMSQPPSGGCVLKQGKYSDESQQMAQPPSGGCVLKLSFVLQHLLGKIPAAFGRLCVETTSVDVCAKDKEPAAFGRLCVETIIYECLMMFEIPSRLRAAVC